MKELSNSRNEHRFTYLERCKSTAVLLNGILHDIIHSSQLEST